MSRQRSRARFLMVESQRETAQMEGGQDIRLLSRLFPYLAKHKGLFIVALVLMPLVAAVSAAQPAITKYAVDAMVAGDVDGVVRMALFLAAAVVGEFLLGFAQTYSMQLGGQLATADLRDDVFAHVQRLAVRYFDRTPVGRVVTRVTSDIDSLSELFSTGAITAAADLLRLAFYAVSMMILDLELALVTFVAIPPLLVIVNAFRRKARVAFRAIRVHVAELNTYMAEQVAGIGVIQAYGKERECAGEYAELNADYRNANYLAIRYDALLYSVVEAVAAASIAGVLFYAAHQALGIGEAGAAVAYIGTVVAFYEYIQRFFIPIRDLSTKYTVIQHALASSERIFQTLDVDELDAPGGDRPLPTEFQGPAIEARGLTFGYRPDQTVLHDIHLSIAPGERVAVVGATGSGKTTLTSLLLRLYEPPEGALFVRGVDVRELDARSLREAFSVVPQDVFLFTGTILENIALDEEIDEDRAREALRKVGALEMVGRRGGLYAQVSERGQNFSAGERQLLAFARAVYRDRPFLILDEATANVDSETEAHLERAVHRALEGRTSIVIAHRLSTIKTADRILVFHHGKLAEQGTHEELLALGGIYQRLHALHFDQAAE
ncbi:MAG: ABC transporter ATP-binding protein [Myxococcales bacterium]|nr:ABC transporter ATP-binding protein [Myxococcales bacterium]